jgi:hypothetical protein
LGQDAPVHPLIGKGRAVGRNHSWRRAIRRFL